jgi:FKBP-type peptidyl-prolyl cis-trans isomerase 2
MTAIKKNDFVEVEYTGKIKEDNFVFDTTSEKTAKENHVHNPHAQYGPTVVCIGQHQLIPGLDEGLVGKELNKEYTFDIPAEKGFGKKSAQLLKLIPISAFKKGKIIPEVGMHVEIDNTPGIVKTVTGGRIVVDFNHPLSGKELVYTIKANKIITDDAEKVISLISLTLNLKKDHIDVKTDKGKATVTMLKLPEVFQKELAKRISEIIPSVKETVFVEKAKTEEKSKTTPKHGDKQPLNTSK